jgi:hypothetical protein
MRWLSKITVPHVGVFFQGCMVTLVTLSAILAWSSWKAEIGKRQTDATLRYFDPLMDRDYIRYLWQIEEFTLCFERAAQRHLSYARYAEVSAKPESFKIAAAWWEFVENEQKEHDDCGKPMNIEEKLMVVYGRLEALASCARQKLCSFGRIVDMIEAVDHMTLLSVSNYLLLTRHRDQKVSREWTMDGALVDLVELVEKHVFEGGASSRSYAEKLDLRGRVLDSQSAIKPHEITAIHAKRTRCDHPVDGVSADWRRCATAER